MSNTTTLTGVGYVDSNGVRAWCDTVVIENEPGCEIEGRPIRQIRGRREGILTFTVWIDPDIDVRIRRQNPNGVVVRAGDVCLDVVRDDFSKPIGIERAQ